MLSFEDSALREAHRIYFSKGRNMDLSKQKILDADSKAIQQINFTGNLVGSIQQYSSLLRNSEKDY